MKKPRIQPFRDFPEYSDPGSVGQVCRDLLDQGAGEATQLQIGICHLSGPGRLAEDAHATWSQYFVVVEGQGTLFLNGKPHLLAKDMIVEIPKYTPHYASCEDGEMLVYFFVNVHDQGA